MYNTVRSRKQPNTCLMKTNHFWLILKGFSTRSRFSYKQTYCTWTEKTKDLKDWPTYSDNVWYQSSSRCRIKLLSRLFWCKGFPEIILSVFFIFIKSKKRPTPAWYTYRRRCQTEKHITNTNWEVTKYSSKDPRHTRCNSQTTHVVTSCQFIISSGIICNAD